MRILPQSRTYFGTKERKEHKPARKDMKWPAKTLTFFKKMTVQVKEKKNNRRKIF